MSFSPLNEDGHAVLDARHRLTPSLPENSAPFLRLRRSPESGFGVFASQTISPGTQILESKEADGPVVYVIYRAFRKEVCAWCFRYEHGRNWRVRFQSESASKGGGGSTGDGGGGGCGGPGPGVVFCREECRDAWKNQYGQLGLEAYAAVEAFVQRQTRCKGWSVRIDIGEDDGNVPSSSEIEEVRVHLVHDLLQTKKSFWSSRTLNVE